MSPPSSPLPAATVAAASKPNSALKVSIPSELQGVAYIEVLCQKGNEFYMLIKTRVILTGLHFK